MIEIKFRALAPDGEMIYWFPEDPSTPYYDPTKSERPFNLHAYLWGHTDKNPHKVMLYTGFSDSGGTDIYAGDIIEFQRPMIDWPPELSESAGMITRRIALNQPTLLEILRNADAVKDGIVIGNIYQNPELLDEIPTK